jgi:hypothetical protein
MMMKIDDIKPGETYAVRLPPDWDDKASFQAKEKNEIFRFVVESVKIERIQGRSYNITHEEVFCHIYENTNDNPKTEKVFYRPKDIINEYKAWLDNEDARLDDVPQPGKKK